MELFLLLAVLKQKTVLMLNWIIWNKAVYLYKMDLALNNLQWLICHKTKPNQIDLFKNNFRYNHCRPEWIRELKQ